MQPSQERKIHTVVSQRKIDRQTNTNLSQAVIPANIKTHGFGPKLKKVMGEALNSLGRIFRDPKVAEKKLVLRKEDIETASLLSGASIDDFLGYLSKQCDCNPVWTSKKTGLLKVDVVDSEGVFFTHKNKDTKYHYTESERKKILEKIGEAFSLKKEEGLDFKNAVKLVERDKNGNKTGNVCYSLNYNDQLVREDKTVENNWRRFDFFINADGSMNVKCSFLQDGKEVTYSDEIGYSSDVKKLEENDKSLTEKRKLSFFENKLLDSCGRLLDKCLEDEGKTF